MIKLLLKTPLYKIYNKRLQAKIKNGMIPQHVGVILDGNRRFARKHGMPVKVGHAMGAKNLKPLIEWCVEMGIPHLTVWVFSTENKGRSEKEVKNLHKLFAEQADNVLGGHMDKNGWVKMKFIGDKTIFPKKLGDKIDEIEEKTKKNTKLNLNIALGYGGRNEIVDAVKSLVSNSKTKSRESLVKSITEEAIDKHIYNQDSPKPDLLIRTSGEVRLSGFMLWQSAYSEYYFTDVLWPEFRKVDFLRALRSYQARNRKFGQ